MKPEIRIAAAEDISKALDFYVLKGRRLAIDFIAEIDRVLRLIEIYPQLGREVGAGHRRFPLSGFPYLVYYRIDLQQRVIEIIAVTHQSRRPNFWRSRVEEPVPGYVLLSAKPSGAISLRQ